jgi:hypothetical protein
MHHLASGRCWPKVASERGIFSVGFGEISWVLRGNSQTTDLAVAIRGNLAEADAQKVATSGGFRPEGDTQI